MIYLFHNNRGVVTLLSELTAETSIDRWVLVTYKL